MTWIYDGKDLYAPKNTAEVYQKKGKPLPQQLFWPAVSGGRPITGKQPASLASVVKDFSGAFIYAPLPRDKYRIFKEIGKDAHKYVEYKETSPGSGKYQVGQNKTAPGPVVDISDSRFMDGKNRAWFVPMVPEDPGNFRGRLVGGGGRLGIHPDGTEKLGAWNDGSGGGALP